VRKDWNVDGGSCITRDLIFEVTKGIQSVP
jgi:hypothetical protein